MYKSFQLVNRAEKRYSPSPIRIVWLQNPQIMTVVHAFLRKQTGFGMARAFLKIRVIGYDLIKLLPPQVLILLNRVEVQCKSVEIGLK